MTSIAKQYEHGLQGAVWNQAAHDDLMASVAVPEASAVTMQLGSQDQFAGQLVIPFVHVERIYPGCWPGAAQGRGDCVSHSVKNTLLGSLVGDVVGGKPDEVSGKRERAPDVSPAGIKQGVLSTETLYWFSGNGARGDGWYSSAAVAVARTKAGAVVRGPLAETGIDLTRYDARLAGKFTGSGDIPAAVADAIDNNLFREVTEVDSFDELRDLLGMGFFITSDGGESWSNQRDANGVSERTRAGWSHAMAVIAADDRPATKKKYGEPLACICNSWGNWNSGSRKILDSEFEIPPGSYWTRWSDMQRRRMYAVSGANGWQARTLPDLSPGFV